LIRPAPAANFKPDTLSDGGNENRIKMADSKYTYDTKEYSCRDPSPAGIVTYASKTDGGRGIAHMWAIGNSLEHAGIPVYNGLMVKTDNWQVKWFGKMSRAKFAIVMLSDMYWDSQPCVEEIKAILMKGVKVFLLRVDTTCHTCTKGSFLGEGEDKLDLAGFIKLKLHMNCLPPPHKPLFQDDFSTNMGELIAQIQKFMDTAPPAPPPSEHGVEPAPAARPAKEWGIDEVVAWLRNPDGPVHAAFAGQADELARKFQEEEVDGDLLLKYDRPSLKADFGLTAGKANKLAAAIEELVAHDSLQPAPEPEAESGVLEPQAEATLIMCSTAQDAEQAITAATDPEAVIARMVEHRTGEVAATGLARLTALAGNDGRGALRMQDEPQRAVVITAGGVTVTLQAMKDFAGDSKVQMVGCKLLVTLMYGSQDVKSSVVNGDGIQIVKAAVMAHGAGSDGVARYGCGALGNIMCNNAANKKLVAAAGCGSLFKMALQTHGATDASVASRVCAALQIFIWRSPENRTVVFQAGCLPFVVAALETHGAANAMLAKDACGLLWELAIGKGNPDRVRGAGSVPPLKVVLDAHGAQNAGVAEQACYVVQQLALTEVGRKDLLDAGCLSPVLAVLKAHGVSSTAVARRACDALGNLVDKLSASGVSPCEVAGCVDAIIAALDAHATSSSFVAVGACYALAMAAMFWNAGSNIRRAGCVPLLRTVLETHGSKSAKVAERILYAIGLATEGESAVAVLKADCLPVLKSMLEIHGTDLVVPRTILTILDRILMSHGPSEIQAAGFVPLVKEATAAMEPGGKAENADNAKCTAALVGIQVLSSDVEEEEEGQEDQERLRAGARAEVKRQVDVEQHKLEAEHLGGEHCEHCATPAPAPQPEPAPQSALAPQAAPAGVTFSLAELQAGCPPGVDPKNKELWLTDAEFAAALGGAKSDFGKLAKWKRDAAKKKAGLF
jgi:hypothetical protein